MQFHEGGRYVAVVVDRKITCYGKTGGAYDDGGPTYSTSNFNSRF